MAKREFIFSGHAGSFGVIFEVVWRKGENVVKDRDCNTAKDVREERNRRGENEEMGRCNRETCKSRRTLRQIENRGGGYLFYISI